MPLLPPHFHRPGILIFSFSVGLLSARRFYRRSNLTRIEAALSSSWSFLRSLTLSKGRGDGSMFFSLFKWNLCIRVSHEERFKRLWGWRTFWKKWIFFEFLLIGEGIIIIKKSMYIYIYIQKSWRDEAHDATTKERSRNDTYIFDDTIKIEWLVRNLYWP